MRSPFLPARSAALSIALLLSPLFFTAALTLPSRAFAQDGAAPETRPATQVVEAEKHMAIAANPHASRAGLAMLRQGGSAVDAAIAMQAVLSLVEPQSSGIGGGGFLLHYNKADEKLIAYDGREKAPQTVDETLFLDEQGKPMGFLEAAFGGRAVGVPGVMAMLALAHQEQGKLPWAELFAPAIDLAENGFEISPRLFYLLDGRARLYRDAGYSLDRLGAAGRYFFTDDLQAKPLGFLLKNPVYAKSLHQIAEQGVSAFYEGEIAQNMVETVQNNPFAPGALSLEDLASYEPMKREAVCGPYRSNRVCSMGPPSSGGTTMLAILGILEGFDLAALAPYGPDAVHLYAEASELAYADRNLYSADPAFVSVPVKGLIDPAYLAKRRALIDPVKAMGEAPAGDPSHDQGALFAPHIGPDIPSTSHLVVVDDAGNVVSFTTTVQIAFGSFLMSGGFIINNQLTDFSFAPEVDGVKVANRVEPGKKPRSSMTPTIVFDEQNRVRMAIGSPGGSRIISFVAKTLVNVLDFEMTIQEAISAPNLVAQSGILEIERDRGLLDLMDALRARGHEVRDRTLNSGLHGLTVHYDEDGTAHYRGGADPRREGVALGD
ncbi:MULTISPECIES: gamma-glutamyltransferase [unclassified Iodidimonas]|uniref:gamma-glutamyltransferase n=1 Tax=unclassified Iodidimonas TaxID=2626145 RepID=UPI0024824A32|nr:MULTISPECIES: gamma-glutamyltransferase [unclassified Iodidimonas]